MAQRKKASRLPHINDAILGKIIAKLEELREESRVAVNQHIYSDASPGEDTPDVGDDLDQASTARDREFSLLMHERHLKRLQQIDEAFERIEDKSYGLCEGTDEPINPKRLLIMPLARYSLEYQEQQEKLLGRDTDGITLEDESFSGEE